MELKNITDKKIEFGDIPDTKNVGGIKKLDAGETGMVFDEDAEKSAQLLKHMLAGNIVKLSNSEPSDNQPNADPAGSGANKNLSNLEAPTDINQSLMPQAPYNVTIGGAQTEWAQGWFKEIKNTDSIVIRSTNNFGSISLVCKGHNYSIAGGGGVALDRTAANDGASFGAGAPLSGVRKMYSTNVDGHGNSNAPFNVRILTADPNDDFQNGDVWFSTVAGVTSLSIRVAGVTKTIALA